ncbi:hypothetical protein PHLCEN_2v7877 [Hermanssonia centrifuga]|uniref:Integrase n=1 Tax=Hermanssonia centrifuga TaxID=98765 RepID=A0A2R6NVA1_9APHY|nr:hypothetical protein PHLCEN_2v7877 [Hermanssonia centrifuga]
MVAVSFEAWAPSTAALYGSGLTTYHLFCDEKGVPERQRAPASSELIEAFVSALAGAYAASTVANYFAAVRAWHVLHRLDWCLNKDQISNLLRAASKLAPESSKRPAREPYTVKILADIFKVLNRNDPFDAAVRFCATSLLFGIARSGELTTKSMKTFDPAINIPARNIRRERMEASGTEVVILHIPKTKADQVNGEDIRFSSQPSLDIDPVEEMENHLRINAPAPDEHLFAYSLIRPKSRPSRVPLSYQRFSSRMKEAAEEAGIRSLLGHAFRIGEPSMNNIGRSSTASAYSAVKHIECESELSKFRALA